MQNLQSTIGNRQFILNALPQEILINLFISEL